jgi:polar amino acid transport system substrate-binding protein
MGNGAPARHSGDRTLSRRPPARIACTLLATLLLVACSDRTSSPAAGVFTPGTPGVLTVVTSQIPTKGFWEGTPSHLTGGFEYELARNLAQRFGLGSVRVRIENFNRVVHGQLNGADIALDLITPTSERAQSLSFSVPYLTSPPTVLVRTGTAVPDLATARTLRWGAVRGTTFAGLIDQVIHPDANLRLFRATAGMLTALEERKIDAVLLDMPLAVVTATRSRGRLDAAGQLPSTETIAAALPKNSANQQAVNSAIRAFTADGTINDLLKMWVGSAAADAEKSIPLIQSTR